MLHASSLFADGPTTHWIGPKTLVILWVEGREINAMADSGSQVNMVMPGYVHQCASIWLGWVAQGPAPSAL